MTRVHGERLQHTKTPIGFETLSSHHVLRECIISWTTHLTSSHFISPHLIPPNDFVTVHIESMLEHPTLNKRLDRETHL